MNIERIRFGISSIYRPNAITKLVRDEKNILTNEAVTLEGEKRQTKDKEPDAPLDRDNKQHTEGELPATVPGHDIGAIVPLDVIA